MKKIEITKEADFLFDWSGGVALSKIKEDIEKMEAWGINKVYIDTGASYYGDTWLIQDALICRLETDKEFEARITEENARLEHIKARELKQLEVLKQKYNL